MGSRRGEPARSQSVHRVPIAPRAARRRVPSAVGPPVRDCEGARPAASGLRDQGDVCRRRVGSTSSWPRTAVVRGGFKEPLSSRRRLYILERSLSGRDRRRSDDRCAADTVRRGCEDDRQQPLPSCCSLEGRHRLEAFERQLAHTGRHTSTSSARILATSLSSEAPHGQATVPWLR